MGARVAMVGRVGRDAFGEQTLNNFGDEKIDTTHVTRDEERPTGVASIAVDDSGGNCIIVIAGANAALSVEDVRRAAPAITAAAVLVAQLETPIAATLEAFRLAKQVGARTILNPAPAAVLPPELLQCTELLVPNEPELEHLTGHRVRGVEDAKAAARQLLTWGPATVIATLGERGVLVVEAEETEYVRAQEVQAVDTTGAGDVFIGTLAAFLAEGRTLSDAVRGANLAASISVTRPGTQTSFPRREEVVPLMA
jgi:ribokinase